MEPAGADLVMQAAVGLLANRRAACNLEVCLIEYRFCK